MRRQTPEIFYSQSSADSAGSVTTDVCALASGSSPCSNGKTIYATYALQKYSTYTVFVW
jgi:hypothetical protein